MKQKIGTDIQAIVLHTLRLCHLVSNFFGINVTLQAKDRVLFLRLLRTYRHWHLCEPLFLLGAERKLYPIIVIIIITHHDYDHSAESEAGCDYCHYFNYLDATFYTIHFSLRFVSALLLMTISLFFPAL